MTGGRPFTVRPARPADAESISALTAAVQALHAAARPDLFRPVSPDTFPPATVRALMAEPDRLFLVAEVASRDAGGRATAVGHAYAEVQRRPATPLTHPLTRLYVHQMAVAAEHRGHGVGTRLLAALGEAARERGIGALALDVWAFNAAARRMYKRAGFVTDRTFLSCDAGALADGPRRPRNAGQADDA